jgi:3-oxoacyl-[acyl-carrier protein] reductase
LEQPRADANENRFSGKVVIVTGAAAGIGRAAALRYGREGASVFAADLDQAGAEDTAATIRRDGGAARAYRVDLSSRRAAQAMVDAAVAAFGRLDVLANVAGIYPDAPVEEVDEDDWDRVLAVDLKGPFFACQAAVCQMKAQGEGGAIANVASGAAFHGLRGLVAYSAAKGGVVAMSRVVAVEAAAYGVRVNTVVPGPTDTPGYRVRHTGDLDIQELPPLLGRQIAPEEIAATIVWCTSDAARALNGALVRVDGGRGIL